MTIHDIADELFEIKRYSDVIYKGQVDTITIDVNPNEEAILLVTLDTAQTGTIYLNGSTTETLTFTNSISENSVNTFTSLAGVTPSGLTGNMTITSHSENNVPVNNLILKQSIYGYFQVKTNKDVLSLPGMRTDYFADFYTDGDATIENEDVIVRKENKVPIYYVVSNVRTITSTDGVNHKEMMLSKTVIT